MLATNAHYVTCRSSTCASSPDRRRVARPAPRRYRHDAWLLVADDRCDPRSACWCGWLRETKRADQMALGLVLGGALGNILDRVGWAMSSISPICTSPLGATGSRFWSSTRRCRDYASVCSSCSCARFSCDDAPTPILGRNRAQRRISMRKFSIDGRLVAARAGRLRASWHGRAPPGPDEFSVARQAPLVIPPDFSLTPPKPGAARANDVSANAQALDALFGGTAARSAAERDAVAGGRRYGRPRHPLVGRRSGHDRGRQGRDHARHRRGARGRRPGGAGDRTEVSV